MNQKSALSDWSEGCSRVTLPFIIITIINCEVVTCLRGTGRSGMHFFTVLDC